MPSNKNFHLQNTKPMVLIGMMGSGKSEIGKKWAKRLHIPFSDSDQCIEKAQHKTIARIFEEEGEAAFRTYEHAILQQLIKQVPCIIATGGGAFIQEKNRTLLLKNSYVIWLKASKETILKRLEGDTTRPLLLQNKEARIEALLVERAPLYAQCHFQLATDGKTPEEIIHELEKAVRISSPLAGEQVL